MPLTLPRSGIALTLDINGDTSHMTGSNGLVLSALHSWANMRDSGLPFSVTVAEADGPLEFTYEGTSPQECYEKVATWVEAVVAERDPKIREVWTSIGLEPPALPTAR